VAPEVVVVVEDEDARAAPRRGLEKISTGKTAETGAYHDQVVVLPGVGFGPHIFPGISVPERMRHLEGASVATSHAGQRRGIIFLTGLKRSSRIVDRGLVPRGGAAARDHQRSRQSNPDSTHEITAGYGSIHP
jgi:hypothetical protein